MSSSKTVKSTVAGFLLFLIIVPFAAVNASSPNISHSYFIAKPVPNGTIVSLNPSKANYVEESNTGNGSGIVGVTVSSDDSLLAFDPDNAKIQVATSGSVTTLVSNVNGDIKTGDQISVSPFNGIGMKTEVGAYVIGLAQTSFNSKSEGASTKTVKDKYGNSKEIQVGYIKLSISVGETIATEDKPLNSLQKVFKALTGKSISTLRILLSLAIGLITTIAVITLIYASIYGSIISVGRNPLAKSIIFRALSSVVAMSILVALVGCSLIYLLLR